MINKLELNYTAEMEKAMYQSHGIGYAKYERNMDERIKVEQSREYSHRASLDIVNDIERQVHR
ncbi:hypothetical protein SAMN04488134_11179 [Amphibacillus marinus]|uniref:Uncharacterized protein n=1 Tax=Amphibacillus marinus TaxID=872970 RepID=A0A1H8RYF3_9BACI|nr:hypothetical protein [Amphibacillus marinus]SEO71168.1 hypothetical protein SAMN04488134_11179 [Amphibacillus marinus]